MGLDFIHLEMNGGREISEWSRVECKFAINTARIPICLLINVFNSQHGLNDVTGQGKLLLYSD